VLQVRRRRQPRKVAQQAQWSLVRGIWFFWYHWWYSPRTLSRGNISDDDDDDDEDSCFYGCHLELVASDISRNSLVDGQWRRRLWGIGARAPLDFH